MAINNTINTRRKRWLLALLAGPAALYLLLFFLLPFVVIIVYSFLTRSPTGGVLWQFTFDNYIKLFSDTIYLQIFWRSIWMGLATTLICLLIGYPLALFIARRNRRWRTILILLILIPFWTNLLVRTYAWMVILGNNGLINNLIGWFGFDPITMLNTGGAVLLGLVYTELPFMVLPLFASIDRFDFRLLEAAGDLGATRRQAFLRIMLPLTMPGIVAGSVLVFIPAAGNYIVPALLGGNKVTLVGNLLEQQFGSAQNKPLGSAAAILVMIVLTLAVILYFRVTSEEDR
jgi:spermidine/putrescine transport system permease protein